MCLASRRIAGKGCHQCLPGGAKGMDQALLSSAGQQYKRQQAETDVQEVPPEHEEKSLYWECNHTF